jgi:WG containing repeat
LNAFFRLLAGVTVVITTTGAGLGQPSLPSPGTTLGSAAQSDELENWARKSGDTLIPTCRFEGTRCGYIDRNGNTIIAPQFDWVDRFVAGRAVVGKAGKYGAIDETGRLVVAPAYDSMTSFDRGLALVLVGDRLGVIDRNGEWVVPARHGAIMRITDDAFLVAEPPYSKGGGPLRPLGDYFNRSHPYAYGKRWGIVVRGGSWIVPPTFAQVSALSEDLNGLFWAADSQNSSPRWQLMRADGTRLSGDLFDHVQQLQPGQDRAVVQRGGRWGAINGRGEIAVELKFDWLGYFRDGWAPYRLAGREGRIDRDGNILSDGAVQPTILDPNVTLGAVVDDKSLLIDKAGTTLLGTDHPKCPDGRHLRFEQGRWTIVTADERPAPDIAFEYVHLACAAPSIVKHDGKWGFISIDGKLVVNRYFDHVNAFHEGIATASDAGLWAVIGEDGSYLLGPLRLARGMFVSGTGVYSIEFEEGYRTLDKALVAQLARDPEVLTRRLPPRLPWSEGVAALFDDKAGKWGFIDASGKLVIAPRFDAVGSFSKGFAWAAHPERREWCLIDKEGRIKPDTPCQCYQPLAILEHYRPPPDIPCYDEGLRIVRGVPVIRETAR